MTILKAAIGFEPIYNSWRGMHERCSNPNNHKYAGYGGRGICVSAEWATFEPFKAWSLANGWADGLMLDRRNNDLGYTPGNCRWATAREQTLNRRNVLKNASGEAFCDIAARNGIGAKTYTGRLARGWCPEHAATVKPNKALGRHWRPE